MKGGQQLAGFRRAKVQLSERSATHSTEKLSLSIEPLIFDDVLIDRVPQLEAFEVEDERTPSAIPEVRFSRGPCRPVIHVTPVFLLLLVVIDVSRPPLRDLNQQVLAQIAVRPLPPHGPDLMNFEQAIAIMTKLDIETERPLLSAQRLILPQALDSGMDALMKPGAEKLHPAVDLHPR